MNSRGNAVITAIILIGALLAGTAFGSLVLGQRAANAELEQRAKQLEKANQGLIIEVAKGDTLQSKYLSLIKELRSLNGGLGDRIAELEGALRVEILEVDVLTARIDSLVTRGTGIVVGTPDSGSVFVRADTLGVHLDAEVRYPGGQYSLLLARDPINMRIYLSKDRDDLDKKTIEFVDSDGNQTPWVRVSKWDVIIEEEPIGGVNWFSHIFGDLTSLGLAVGLSAGDNIGGLAVIRIGEMYIGTEFVKDDTRLLVAREFW